MRKATPHNGQWFYGIDRSVADPRVYTSWRDEPLTTAPTPTQAALMSLQNTPLRDGLVRVYEVWQRDERRSYYLEPAIMCHAANAWRAALAVKVKASDDKRREADRLQVVVDNSWWDD